MLRKRLIEQLYEEKSKIEKYVTMGQIHDFAAYKFFIGQIKGLQDSIDICKNIMKVEDNE